MLPRPLALTAAVALALVPLAAQRGRGLRVSGEGWVNEDLVRGVRLAKAEGRPLMVVFRCPP